LTDGADEAEVLLEAADCLSEALASRIADGEEIPAPTAPAAGQPLVSPDPTIALKAALYPAMRRRDMTVADLADRLRVTDWHQAARLIDPKRSTKLTRLAAVLDALDCRIAITIEEITPAACRREKRGARDCSTTPTARPSLTDRASTFVSWRRPATEAGAGSRYV
jgi:antitoxin HicB